MIRTFFNLLILIFVLIPIILWVLASEPTEEDRIRDLLHPR